MNTIQAFLRGQIAIANNSPHKVFDWKKAVSLIKKHNIKTANAGLAEDMEWTSDCILRDGRPITGDGVQIYLSSNWATPILVDHKTGEEFECWEFQKNSKYDSGTVWPEDALVLLNGEPK